MEKVDLKDTVLNQREFEKKIQQNKLISPLIELQPSSFLENSRK